MSIQTCREGDTHCQHRAMLAELYRLRRLAYSLAETSVADAWEDAAIVFADEVLQTILILVSRCERLEDLGQIPLPEY